MNELNSVYMVGTVKTVETFDDGKQTILVLTNKTYSKDRETIINFTVMFPTNASMPKIKDGMRIGVNGRLDSNGQIFINAYTVQILEPAKRVRQVF